MPIPWLAVLQSVPWTEVVKNAPKVAEGAKKLWSAATRKTSSEASTESENEVASSSQSNAALAARIAELEITTADLHAQMIASSELIKALADQNTELIHRLDTLHRRTRWLAFALMIGAAVLVRMAW
jgi:septal ring factor EnvC (AmiA/AmiB activator)